MFRFFILYYLQIEFFFIFVFSKSIVNNPVLLISLNGLNSEKFDEFLIENPNSVFRKIIANGIKANYLLPSFPTQTYPNHWTLVTG